MATFIRNSQHGSDEMPKIVELQLPNKPYNRQLLNEQVRAASAANDGIVTRKGLYFAIMFDPSEADIASVYAAAQDHDFRGKSTGEIAAQNRKDRIAALKTALGARDPEVLELLELLSEERNA